MHFWKRSRVNKQAIANKTPAQQREELINSMKRVGANEYEIKLALKRWETDRTKLGFNQGK